MRKIIFILMVYISFSSCVAFASNSVAVDVNNTAISFDYKIEAINGETTEKATIQSTPDAVGLTSFNISYYKDGADLRFSATTQSSNTATQIGIRNGYIEQKINGKWTIVQYIPTYYTANASYQYKSLIYTNASGEFRITFEHYCIIGGVTYSQWQTTSPFII